MPLLLLLLMLNQLYSRLMRKIHVCVCVFIAYVSYFNLFLLTILAAGIFYHILVLSCLCACYISVCVCNSAILLLFDVSLVSDVQ